MHPNADIGEFHPPALKWKHFPHKEISHVVIGSGKPGGLWHNMQPNLQTLSIGSWLELPMYRFEEWDKDKKPHIEHKQNHFHSRPRKKWSEGRVCLGDVAHYYSDYVTKMGLESNFVNNAIVTNITRLERRHRRSCSSESDRSLSSVSSPEPDCELNFHCATSCAFINHDLKAQDLIHFEIPTHQETSPFDSSDPDDNGVFCNPARRSCCGAGHRWSLRAEGTTQYGKEQNIVVCAKNVVLACGVGGYPRRLHVPGEDLPYVSHDFSDLALSLPKIQHHADPVLIVGAGLSAADAVLCTLSRTVRVVHVFYQDSSDPKLIYHKMPPQLYSEYCSVFDLMRGKTQNSLYTPLPRHRVVEFRPEGISIVENEEGMQQRLRVLTAQVLIGSEANLDFLPEDIVRKLGLHLNLPINAKKNPVDVDPFTFESEKVPHLYALGPLVGDNFVRFALGGVLGVTQNLHKNI